MSSSVTADSEDAVATATALAVDSELASAPVDALPPVVLDAHPASGAVTSATESPAVTHARAAPRPPNFAIRMFLELIAAHLLVREGVSRLPLRALSSSIIAFSSAPDAIPTSYVSLNRLPMLLVFTDESSW